MAIVLAPCIPFLLGFPAMAYYALLFKNFFEHETSIVVAYGLGNVIYLIAASSLYAFMTNSFDRLAGRCGELSERD